MYSFTYGTTVVVILKSGLLCPCYLAFKDTTLGKGTNYRFESIRPHMIFKSNPLPPKIKPGYGLCRFDQRKQSISQPR